MRKVITVVGTLLTVMILFCGSAVAAWVWVEVYDEDYTTDIYEIEDAPDNVYATIGQNPSTLGWVILDLGISNAMGASQDFVVVAQSSVSEDYDVFVGETSDVEYMEYVGSGNDTQNNTFTTPSTVERGYQYILIDGQSGVIAGDYYYGPDIDAVGWNKP
jgi:hypothetical protein